MELTATVSFRSVFPQVFQDRTTHGLDVICQFEPFSQIEYKVHFFGNPVDMEIVKKRISDLKFGATIESQEPKSDSGETE